jgi:mono/diheme cytochrome c family protein
MIRNNLIYKILSFGFLIFALPFATLAADGDWKAGKTLFQGNCASCHKADMKGKGTGPALAGVEERWDTRENLRAWIKNSQQMINTVKHPRAVALWNEWKPTVMQPFALSDEQIDNIIAYINCKASGTCDGPAKPDAATAAAKGGDDEKGNKWFVWGLLGVLALLAAVLYQTVGFLDAVAKAKAGEAAGPRKTFMDFLLAKRTLSILTFFVVVAAGYLTVQNAVSLGRQQGYAPAQPINFSHTLHAGKHKIDCQYCHDGARRSKHSNIPGVSTCMNCHTVVQQGAHEGAAAKGASSAEILKIYAAAGYNPNLPSDKAYIENAEKLGEAELKAIYHHWIDSVYNAAGMKPNERVQLVEDAFQAAKAMFYKPIEWVRIHNLPDHAYFNHAQHVTAGGLQCQTCHGPVEKMDLMYQYSPLSMGWCINCHRKTEVKFAQNGYYSEYFKKYHEEIKNGTRSSVTVEDIGGLECQKCHY